MMRLYLWSFRLTTRMKCGGYGGPELAWVRDNPSLMNMEDAAADRGTRN